MSREQCTPDNDNSDGDQPPTPRAVRMAHTIRFWIESDLSAEQMKEKLALQYAEARPSEIEHALLLAQAMIIADEEEQALAAKTEGK